MMKKKNCEFQPVNNMDKRKEAGKEVELSEVQN